MRPEANEPVPIGFKPHSSRFVTASSTRTPSYLVQKQAASPPIAPAAFVYGLAGFPRHWVSTMSQVTQPTSHNATRTEYGRDFSTFGILCRVNCAPVDDVSHLFLQPS